MHDSPCPTCLVFPCCTKICPNKMRFTAERVVRLSIYKKINHDELMQDGNFQGLMKNLWEENIKIAHKGFDSKRERHPDAQCIYKIESDTIKDEIKKESESINTKFCLSLFRKFNIHL